VGHAVDVVQFGLAVPRLAVVQQPAHPPRLLSGVHTEGKEIKGTSMTWCKPLSLIGLL
jgi:hypothetical protein